MIVSIIIREWITMKRILILMLILCLFLTMMPMVSAENSTGNTKLVALTFDDGPCSGTSRLLDGLKERGVNATFFLQGYKAEKNQEIIQRMIREGHQVANHSYNHPDMNTLSLDAAKEQFTRTDGIINSATGGNGANYYRAPYGNSTEALRESLEGPLFYWSLDTGDWDTRNRAMIRDKIKRLIFDGAIVLSHDTVPATTDATFDVIDALQYQGYEFVTLKELFRRRGLEATSGKEQYFSCKPTDVLLAGLERPIFEVKQNGSRLSVTLSTESNAPIYYHMDGTPILMDAEKYTRTFSAELPCTITAVAAFDLNGSRSEMLTLSYESQSGTPQTTLEDHAKLTRGMLAQLLYERSGVKLQHAEDLFRDVPLDHKHAEAITWAYSAGVFDGTGSRVFEPDAVATRQEVAKVLVSFLDMTSKKSDRVYEDDDKIAFWAKEDVYTITAVGLVQGGTDGCFHPESIMTGEEIKLVLQRMETMR